MTSVDQRIPDPVADAARAALLGELIVVPTDTVYGIGTRPDDPAATARLFDAKQRPRELELPILASTFEQLRDVARLDDRAELLAEAFWPGPLTLVLPRMPQSSVWDLGGDAETIGVRIPAHPLARALLVETGPLAVTSANRSGEPPARTCDELTAAFGDLVRVYLCQEGRLEGPPSTVVDLAHGPPRLVRGGALDPADVARQLPDGGSLLDSRASS
jgi:tRNA threonylcarbamoyl adenosine modification protein (Sua5/YciO/YrdC/YwlC family)